MLYKTIASFFSNFILVFKTFFCFPHFYLSGYLNFASRIFINVALYALLVSFRYPNINSSLTFFPLTSNLLTNFFQATKFFFSIYSISNCIILIHPTPLRFTTQFVLYGHFAPTLRHLVSMKSNLFRFSTYTTNISTTHITVGKIAYSYACFLRSKKKSDITHCSNCCTLL